MAGHPRGRTLASAALLAAAVVLVGCAGNGPAIAPELRAGSGGPTLTAEQQRIYDAYKAARDAYEAQASAYWSVIERKKDERRSKRRSGTPFAAEDFVVEHPPKYTGPKLPDEIAKILAGDPELTPPPELPSLTDFLAHAKTYYDFEPERVSEAEFKRRYAAEALAVGLTKAQVVRVYALETGGNGTFDMQAGIHPIKRTGRPISTALGYAQLLAANTVNELVLHGRTFQRRLRAMAARPGVTGSRARALKDKVTALDKMIKVARSVPNRWSEHTKLSRTPKGLGMHALNLDGDIGPWLQVYKLVALKNLADRDGRSRLAPHEIELMNLAGPRTGLDMMLRVSSGVSTANFFSRRGYERNSIVREKTASELLDALSDRMDVNEKREGAIEFARIFDQLKARR